MAFNAKGTLWTCGSGSVTPGTTVQQQAAVNSWVATTPLFSMFNAAPANGPTIWPNYLRLSLSGTAPTGTVSFNLSIMVDSTSRLPTAANQYTNPVPVNADTRDQTTASVCKLYHYLAAQAFTSPAASGSVREVARLRIPTGLGITGDEYILQFNQQDQPGQVKAGQEAVRATDVARAGTQGAGWNLGPNLWANVYIWWLTSATTVQTWETEFCWYELA